MVCNSRPSSAQGDIACYSYNCPRHGFGRLALGLATLQALYVNGERICQFETSERDAEMGGNSISDNGY